MSSNRVAVIGAGLAGLTTAYRLQQAGLKVDVYEARNRVGGRVFTVNVGGVISELGAQNITDGGEALHIHQLAEECGLALAKTQVEFAHSFFDGVECIPVRQLLSKKRYTPQILRNQLNKLATISQNMKEILDGMFKKNDPLYKILAVRLAAYEGAPAENLSPFYVETLFHMLLGGICSVHQGNGEEENYVNLASIKGGNALLPKTIAERLGTRLHLNMPLSRVSRHIDGSFALAFHDGHKVKVDILILAIPCSVYEKIHFDENVIALDRLNAIKNVRYGTNAKILVPFSAAPSRSTGLINDQIVTFFDAEQRTLTVYCTGEASLFCNTTILNTYTQVRPMIELGYKEACPPFTAPIFAQDCAFAAYDAPVGYSWPNDPYAKGSYSYISPGQEALLTTMRVVAGETCKTLFAPIDQKLYFAGEHASILMDVPGTMEAACESGERAARMILKACEYSLS